MARSRIGRAAATVRALAWGLAALASSVAPAAAAEPDGAPLSVRMTVQADHPGPVIDRHVYGQFAEQLGHGIYGGVWVGEGSPIPNTHGYRNDVLAALRAIHVPVIRWPGGCFADGYDWRDGVGPRDRRPVRVNTNWGGVEESNAFGAKEFMDFAELVGADAYVAGDVGSAPPRDLADWVEYITSPTRSTLAQQRRADGRAQPWALPYVGIGNELWGCGGHMRADYAADLFRRYATFVKTPPGRPAMKIASGPNADDYAWTDTLMRLGGDQMGGLSLHYYTLPTGDWASKGPSTGFGEAAYIATLSRALAMDTLIARHSAIMDKYDPQRRVALVVDEWGVWTDPDAGTDPGFLRQQNSLRDALAAAVTLDIFNAHAERVRMANIAQMVNVLQAMLLTDGPKMVRTPTYYVFDLYQGFMGATALPLSVQAPRYRYAGFDVPAVHASAARGADGVVHVALVDLDPHRGAHLSIALPGVTASRVSGRLLSGPAVDSIDTFERPDTVAPRPFAGARLSRSAGGDAVLEVDAPAKALIVLDLR
jgi:alpha-N-arabinofuranosidase